MRLTSSQKVDVIVRTVLPSFILLLTGLRLFARGRRRWQWDDALVSLGCMWMLLQAATSIAIPFYDKSDSTRLAMFYTSFMSFNCALWCARLSILLSVIRITPTPREKTQRLRFMVGFLILCFVEIAQLCWICVANPTWTPSHIPACFGKKRIVILHLIFTLISDSFLLILPLTTLRDLSLSAPRVRTRLSLAFLASACTTIISITACLLVLIANNFVYGYLSILEGCSSLAICNLPVLVVAIRRALGINDLPKTANDLPPIEFAPRQKNGHDPSQPSSTNSLTNAFIPFSLGVHDDEDECDAEVKKIRGLRLWDQLSENSDRHIFGVKDIDMNATPTLRRHSMCI